REPTPDPTHQRIQLGHNTIQHHTTDLPAPTHIGVVAVLAAHSAAQCGPCRFGLPSVAEDFTALATGRTDPDLLSRLHRRIGLLPDRGACRHPDGAARLAASALHVFSDDVHRHLTHAACPSAHHPPRILVPPAAPPETWR
ncbi:hypothetical protein GL309_08535, partial [Nocardia seriolae]|nr:hypothetical protein [Nocardia seriolae]